MRDIIKNIAVRIASAASSLNLEVDHITLSSNIEQLEIVTDNIPDWWLPNNNVLMAPAGCSIPHIFIHPGAAPPKDFIIAIRSNPGLKYIMCWGDNSLILIGNRVNFGGGVIACGSRSTMIVEDDVRSTGNSNLDARNGGVIFIGTDGLWASDVTVLTDACMLLEFEVR